LGGGGGGGSCIIDETITFGPDSKTFIQLKHRKLNRKGYSKHEPILFSTAFKFHSFTSGDRLETLTILVCKRILESCRLFVTF
jgi:hypothetical protein